MAHCTDDNATPRPLRVLIPDEWAERSPYIPRRKSSNNEGPMQAASMTNVTRLSRVHRDKNNPQDSYVQKARFPIDGYDPPLGRALHQIPLQRGSELRRPFSALKQSSSRRFLNRMFSNLPFPSNGSRTRSTDSSASNSKLGRTHRRCESKTSSRASSTLSVSTVPSSSQDNTVRRRRQLALNTILSVISDSPNPLRVPPPSLLGPTQDNSAVSEAEESISSTTGGSAESLNVPSVAYGHIHYLTLASNSQSKNSYPCSVWAIVEILCSLNQGANQEPFAQKQYTSKSFNNPGFLKSVALSLSTLPNCQITAILGQCTAATLSPEQTITAIVLVTLDKSLLPSTRPSPRKENRKPEASSSRRRPTSDVLNEELLHQLLGKFKRTSQAKEDKIEERILIAKVTYEHSLFPPGHQISHEETVNIKPDTICNGQYGSLQKRKEKPEHGPSQCSATEKMNSEETENAAERVIRVLREGLRSDGNTTDAASHPTVDASQAVKLLNDFLAAATSLAPNTNRTLEMLKFRYAMLIENDGRTTPHSTASPKRYNPFDRRKDERRKSAEPESPRHTPYNAVFDSDRRNAFEIDREKMDFDQGLTDVTNGTRFRCRDLLSGDTNLLDYDGITGLGKDNAIPAPLFSPKRATPLVLLSGNDLPTLGSAGTPEKTGYHGGRQHLPNHIGSASFYAAEVEQMAREAFGGTTTICHHWSEFLHQSIEKDEGAGGRRDGIEEDGNDKARMIWERMRISSEGSGTSAKSTEVRYSDESADEDEMSRESKAVGAPWLA